MSPALGMRCATRPVPFQVFRPEAASKPSPFVSLNMNNNVGIIEFTRPERLNALSSHMIEDISKCVKARPSTTTSKGERVFCVGGDIKEILETKRIEGTNKAMGIFQNEYRLGWELAASKKPVVAVMDGLTFGGGAGLAINASFSVATEHTVLGMSGTGIGFFPDAGATYFLSHLDSHIGTLMGLTGKQIYGLATHYIPSHRIGNLVERLALCGPKTVFNSVLEEFSGEFQPESAIPYVSKTQRLFPERDFLQRVFAVPTLGEIYGTLRWMLQHAGTSKIPEHYREYAHEILELLEQACPTSLAVTLELLQRGSRCGLGECLELEYIACRNILESVDFEEGVDAKLISKPSRKAKWKPVESASKYLTKGESVFEKGCVKTLQGGSGPKPWTFPPASLVAELDRRCGGNRDLLHLALQERYGCFKMGLVEHVGMVLSKEE